MEIIIAAICNVIIVLMLSYYLFDEGKRIGFLSLFLLPFAFIFLFLGILNIVAMMTNEYSFYFILQGDLLRQKARETWGPHIPWLICCLFLVVYGLVVRHGLLKQIDNIQKHLNGDG